MGKDNGQGEKEREELRKEPASTDLELASKYPHLYYYLRDEYENPRVFVCLILMPLRVVTRGMSICSFCESPIIKVGREYAKSRAEEAVGHVMGMPPYFAEGSRAFGGKDIRSNAALAVLEACGAPRLLKAVKKAAIPYKAQVYLTRMEKRIIKAYYRRHQSKEAKNADNSGVEGKG